jgi:type VI secretion system secreted protein VgrG
MSVSRALSIESPVIPMVLGRPALEPVHLSGREGVNSLFEYELLLQTPDSLTTGAVDPADWNLASFIGREISCRIELDGSGPDGYGAGVREINALITEAALWGAEGRHVQYRLKLRPWLHRAQLDSDYRHFHNKTCVQVIEEVLAAHPFPVDKRLIETYPVRDYRTQANEKGFEFLSRVMQENGISYFFEHSEGKHRLVLIDNMGAYKSSPSAAYHEIDYHAAGWKTDAEYVHRFVPQQRLTPGRYATSDYDYTRPRADLYLTRSDPHATGQADQEMYQYHDAIAGSHYAQPLAGTAGANDVLAEGREVTRVRMQALRAPGIDAEASGNLRGMVPGCRFALKEHPSKKANTDYLVLETRLLIEDVGQDSQRKDVVPGRQQQWRVEVDFTAHPMSEQLRPAFDQKPRHQGAQTARVVGPEGQNIWTDRLGRIKVQFVWDRVGQNDQNSSCWVRVVMPAAGNQQGSSHIPRIGQEVLITFIGGDPDRPICVGVIPNQDNLPPWRLPDQAALSGFRSRELTPKGGNSAVGRSNHLILDDTDQKIQAQLKSDHQSSSLSLGHITRIDDNEGRKDARGEGFEVRSDGHGAVRASKGLLLTTDARPQAVGGILSRDELIACLEQALMVAKELGEAAVHCKAGTRDTQPQQHLTQAVGALGHGTSPEADAKGAAPAGQPVLALSGAAGIASATPKDHAQYAGRNIDTVAGHNQQHYAAGSILQSAGKDIEHFAVGGDIRTIANHGKVIQQAQHNGFEITAEKAITITSTKEDIVLRAKNSITATLEDGTYLTLVGGQVIFGMKNFFIVRSAGRRFEGAGTLSADMAQFPDAGFDDSFVLRDEEGTPQPHTRYRLLAHDNAVIEGMTGADAIVPLQKALSPDGLMVQLLRTKS